jgi:hypothetical protein
MCYSLLLCGLSELCWAVLILMVDSDCGHLEAQHTEMTHSYGCGWSWMTQFSRGSLHEVWAAGFQKGVIQCVRGEVSDLPRPSLLSYTALLRLNSIGQRESEPVWIQNRTQGGKDLAAIFVCTIPYLHILLSHLLQKIGT